MTAPAGSVAATAAAHNRMVKLLLDPAYHWTTPQDFFDAVRLAEPCANDLEIARAGIEALELILERAEELVTAFRLKGSCNPAFDPRTGDVRAKLAGVWLAFEPSTPELLSRAVQARFGLNDRQVSEAFDVANRMLSVHR
ncbi:hypothetical protein CO731_01668 [Aminobacter sp. MSH1]|uniref:hypothetical protein n=1 Tax=Aminobacter sp. MSH1 TaxID=374606 RepID=UPI000D3E84C7|nr:hypothetical protein [Aminobacter sp. MSH1]AWC22212.1 hypothetical protein CO731_01668 [Aminobacter sp. MSH1]